MKENKYDDKSFFEKYSLMDRSKKGLAGAGEWPALKRILPDFKGKRVLDLGCGFGWHCRYASENGALSVIGTDISEKMLARAQAENGADNVRYMLKAIEDIDFPEASFDIVMSSLALHYTSSFDSVCINVNKILTKGGCFVFSAEHPVFTSDGGQDWHKDKDGNILHWPLDNYFIEGVRQTGFLGESVTKYHRTLSTYLNGLIKNGFEINEFIEPTPTDEMLRDIPAMKDELRRPMMFIVSAIKI